MKLGIDDLFLLSEIADKMNINLPDSQKFDKGKKIEKSQEEYGKEIIEILVKNAYKAKEPMIQLLENVTGKKKEDMDIIEVFDEIKNLFKAKGVMGFFKSADSSSEKK